MSEDSNDPDSDSYLVDDTSRYVLTIYIEVHYRKLNYRKNKNVYAMYIKTTILMCS